MRTPVNIERGNNAARGLPRPLARDGHEVLRPLPWTNSDEGWGILDEMRGAECANFSKCLVCGEHVSAGKCFVTNHIMPLSTIREDLRRSYVVDGAPLHTRCARLTEAHCQTVRDKLRLGEWFVVPYCDEDHTAIP